jgi:DNA polymerase III subunit epsilon
VAVAAEHISNFPFPSRASVREKLFAFLEARPGGADAGELYGLLFNGSGSDPELGPRMIRHLLGADPNFAFDPSSGRWLVRKNEWLKIALGEARYVVVDIETTGGRVAPGAITEIGAYKMEGPRITDSFQSLVRPRMRISRFVTALTSITDEMVRDAPPIEAVMPAFREFLGDAVMVAHNAQFDAAFLDFEFRRIFGIGLTNPVLCTVRLARRFLPSVKRRRLDALAEHFGLSTEGRHRGLGDARMAAELLAILLEIARGAGINRLDLLLDYQHRGAAGRRIERHLPPETIAALPQAPGIYLMRNARGDILYIGKAKRLKDRVGSYFAGGLGLSAKTVELIGHVYEIETRLARSSLEAALLEARLIRELKPPYNRMLKGAAPAYFIRLDLMDPFPRLVVSRSLCARRGVMHLGPFIGRRSLDLAVGALSQILGLRTCAGKLAPDPEFSPCVYGQMGRCAQPCNLTVDEDSYGARVRRAMEFLRGRSGPIMGELARARDQAAAATRFEEAARAHRDLEALATLSSRADRLSRAVTENNLVIVTGAAEDRAAHVVLGGRLALSRKLESARVAVEIAAFVAENYGPYRAKPVARDELEAMTIVARWLRERDPDEGRLLYLSGSRLDPAALEKAPSSGRSTSSCG